MNFSALYINFVAFTLLFASKYSCLEDIFIENEHVGLESEPQSPDLGPGTSEDFKFFQDPSLYNNDSSTPKDQSSVSNSTVSNSVVPPSDVKFYTLDPNDETKVVEIHSDKYTVRQNSNNPYKFQYDFADGAYCIKVKCDNTTIWRSGDFKIDEAKFVIYNTKTDRITIRDHERYVIYRLVDDTPDKQTDSEPLPAKDEPRDLDLPVQSPATYVTYVADPVKVSRQRTKPSLVAVMVSLFVLLSLMALMLIGLLLLVVRLYKVVDQIKFDIGRTETKVVL
ncbi:hypothetical protein MACJ_001669 [Theileria orientalis]|uniref:Uncharacterized protein n=1 Tax=Theileria orientalis TaxID=68886 RepID=A0A976M8Y4_THEOR|nr:hypothetical protein MACJ_001669 [Theileria orientalis]